MATAVATLGGGCFWCLEAAFIQLRGVLDVTSGYCGGHVAQPSYGEVCAGDTGHAEVVHVTFDPDIIDYRTLLLAFFAIHDPTTPNRQGHDVGSQYRSVIFTHGAEQQRITLELIETLTREQTWPDPVVTEVIPVERFWPAEEHHQNYFANNPRQPYCMAVVAPKAAKLREVFKDRLK
ncbi:MAG: peptide-methionine (S)-S-oxide reductase MsrA [Rhodocyclaceae bacterium]|jgi:peptide-methionine (S)-S-oxide reductase|nr:peptide-methionine (S)-S-oxide reductase MsrA [Rhodocyclaceae bacterium]MBK6555356.1 peptide-methionine (S)-S-oxide reductase MsrA [Rhodocyclaceae bacterium]MBK6676736.1 peptide-methionine (S)-S-oxide reductase MsrA [Rhodocyclaceae bacterium]MBK7815623.1 peptide-methionine (S)-S-oxide reductase MsrA [Rhodocyclaceae bacterium]MBK9309360.1 peptide-methionine (S)-S-oxide reductase MsrA [Rhodocyclaceae bacterium]